MKQANFKGFAASYIAAAMPPMQASEEVVALCRDEADAIAYSLNYAFKRFGLRQLDVAINCGWKSDSCLSDAKKRRRGFPEERLQLFGYVTGCTLLEQVIDRARGEKRRQGKETDNDRAEAAVELLIRSAA